MAEEKSEIFDEILTTAEAAKYLKLSEQVVRRLDIPKMRKGQIVRYRKKDLEAWVEARMQTVPEESPEA
ncbi:helix-turn-helix domain-containing protein [uncultured Treponema sp.]|uniref:helix-turn-helix domain-containing protein n=1 Tax=uncultured Treponema sp. TaxID=162155 RepID=UPI0025F098A4|nr:helix-turn-helix domain-containing protein [uncultured Treponema sp.]